MAGPLDMRPLAPAPSSIHRVGVAHRYRYRIERGRRGCRAEFEFVDLPLTLRFHSARTVERLAAVLYGLAAEIEERSNPDAFIADDVPF